MERSRESTKHMAEESLHTEVATDLLSQLSSSQGQR